MVRLCVKVLDDILLKLFVSVFFEIKSFGYFFESLVMLYFVLIVIFINECYC